MTNNEFRIIIYTGEQDPHLLVKYDLELIILSHCEESVRLTKCWLHSKAKMFLEESENTTQLPRHRVPKNSQFTSGLLLKFDQIVSTNGMFLSMTTVKMRLICYCLLDKSMVGKYLEHNVT